MRILLAAAILPLAGCVTVSAPDGPGDTPQCKAEPAQALVGQTASSETGARALSLSKARTLRWGPPNGVWTMDLRPDRVNVRYNDAMTITEVTCG